MDDREQTWALAYKSRPPIGANIIPMTKKRGSTVLGVRIGLLETVRRRRGAIGISETKYCHAFNRCCRKAVSVIKQCLVSPSQ